MTILEIYNFPSLYCKDINGKIKLWKINVERYRDYSVIVTLYGYNKLIENRRLINSGKNIGKINGTDPYTQALNEAKSKWNKKKDIEKYTLKIKEEENGEILENPLPMLAYDYKKYKHKVLYPCYVQPKLDGFRCIYNTTTGKITTRRGKEYVIIEKSGDLYDELKSLPKELILDGELYTKELKFETLGVLRKTTQLSENDMDNLKKVEFHIYDIINTDESFETRTTKIRDILNKDNYKKLIYVDTYNVVNENDIKSFHKRFVEGGYEGTIIRNKNSKYKIKQRSTDLLKYKDFEDGEFEIVDFTLEKAASGQEIDDLVVWVVNVPAGNNTVKCKVRPMGTIKERKELYKKCLENFEQFRGRKLWIKYFEKTNDGNLRFPTTKCNTFTEYIRDIIM